MHPTGIEPGSMMECSNPYSICLFYFRRKKNDILILMIVNVPPLESSAKLLDHRARVFFFCKRPLDRLEFL